MANMETGKQYIIRHEKHGTFQIECTGFSSGPEGGHPTAWGVVSQGEKTGVKVRLTNGLFSWQEVEGKK